MRILVVEDEDAIAKGLKFNFEREGYQVDSVSDGMSALELYESAQPPIDLIVLDLMLPQMSGYETCRALRRLDADIPVLALTARTLSEDKAQACCNDYRDRNQHSKANDQHDIRDNV